MTFHVEQLKLNKMTTKQIKSAVSFGLNVHWSNTSYEVILDNKGQYLIGRNDSFIGLTHRDGNGLTHRDGKTLNGNKKDFFIDQHTTNFPIAVVLSDGSSIVCVDYEELINTIDSCLDEDFEGFTYDLGVIYDNVTPEQIAATFEEVTRQGLLPLMPAESLQEVLYCIVGVNDAAAGEPIEVSDNQRRIFIQFLTILNRH